MRRVICLLLAFLFLSCKEHEKKAGVLPKDSVDVILDALPTAPFSIEKKSQMLIPDSLGGKGLKGFVAMNVYLDSSAILLNYDLLKLRAIDENGNVIVDYQDFRPSSNGKVYPEKLKRYLPFIEDYLKSTVFIRNKNSPYVLGEVNKITFMARFNE